MDPRLAEEFEATFKGKTYNQKEIESELFKIAMKYDQKVCLVMMKFYVWIGLIPEIKWEE